MLVRFLPERLRNLYFPGLGDSGVRALGCSGITVGPSKVVGKG